MRDKSVSKVCYELEMYSHSLTFFHCPAKSTSTFYQSVFYFRHFKSFCDLKQLSRCYSIWIHESVFLFVIVNSSLTSVFTPYQSVCCHRAIYFAAYSTAKEKLNGILEPDSMQMHMVSAGMAGNDCFLPPFGLSVAVCC